MSKLKFTTETILLTALSFPAKIQAREELNEEALEDYTEKAKAANAKGGDNPFPNLRAVRREGGEIVVFSGFTRGKALKKAGYTEVKVDIAPDIDPPLSDRELFLMAIQANSEHGARLTNADKHHNLLKALKFPEYAELSNSALAEIIGTGEKFVRTNRPVSASPKVVTTKKGHKVDKSRIGKKGGKKASPAKKKGKGKKDAVDPETEALDASLKDKDKSSFSLNETEARSLTRICAVIEGHDGFTGKGLREAVEKGTLKVTGGDLVTWSGTSDGRIRQIVGLVINHGWSPKKAYAFIDQEITSKTKVEHIVNLAIAGGGYTRYAAGSKLERIGEKVTDSGNFTILAFDHSKFKVEVTPL